MCIDKEGQSRWAVNKFVMHLAPDFLDLISACSFDLQNNMTLQQSIQMISDNTWCVACYHQGPKRLQVQHLTTKHPADSASEPAHQASRGPGPPLHPSTACNIHIEQLHAFLAWSEIVPYLSLFEVLHDRYLTELAILLRCGMMCWHEVKSGVKRPCSPLHFSINRVIPNIWSSFMFARSPSPTHVLHSTVIDTLLSVPVVFILWRKSWQEVRLVSSSPRLFMHASTPWPSCHAELLMPTSLSSFTRQNQKRNNRIDSDNMSSTYT